MPSLPAPALTGPLPRPPAVAIVLFRSLAQFSGASFAWSTLPRVMLRFVGLALGSLLVRAYLHYTL